MPAKRQKSQEGVILEILLRARGDWVPALTLAAVSLQYSARVFSLRRRAGLAIENKLEIGPDGIKRGFSRLRLSGGIPTKIEPAPKPATPDALFGLDELERCAPPSEYPR